MGRRTLSFDATTRPPSVCCSVRCLRVSKESAPLEDETRVSIGWCCWMLTDGLREFDQHLSRIKSRARLYRTRKPSKTARGGQIGFGNAAANPTLAPTFSTNAIAIYEIPFYRSNSSRANKHSVQRRARRLYETARSCMVSAHNLGDAVLFNQTARYVQHRFATGSDSPWSTLCVDDACSIVQMFTTRSSACPDAMFGRRLRSNGMTSSRVFERVSYGKTVMYIAKRDETNELVVCFVDHGQASLSSPQSFLFRDTSKTYERCQPARFLPVRNEERTHADREYLKHTDVDTLRRGKPAKVRWKTLYEALKSYARDRGAVGHSDGLLYPTLHQTGSKDALKRVQVDVKWLASVLPLVQNRWLCRLLEWHRVQCRRNAQPVRVCFVGQGEAANVAWLARVMVGLVYTREVNSRAAFIRSVVFDASACRLCFANTDEAAKTNGLIARARPRRSRYAPQEFYKRAAVRTLPNRSPSVLNDAWKDDPTQSIDQQPRDEDESDASTETCDSGEQRQSHLEKHDLNLFLATVCDRDHPLACGRCDFQTGPELSQFLNTCRTVSPLVSPTIVCVDHAQHQPTELRGCQCPFTTQQQQQQQQHSRQNQHPHEETKTRWTEIAEQCRQNVPHPVASLDANDEDQPPQRQQEEETKHVANQNRPKYMFYP